MERLSVFKIALIVGYDRSQVYRKLKKNREKNKYATKCNIDNVIMIM